MGSVRFVLLSPLTALAGGLFGDSRECQRKVQLRCSGFLRVGVLFGWREIEGSEIAKGPRADSGLT